MSAKDQHNDNHGGHHHKWKARMKDWFVLPCSHVPKRPEGITVEELSKHDGRPVAGGKPSCWIAVEGFVYDVTQFMPFHPGGELIFRDVLGRDCTWEFQHNHLSFKISDATPELVVGPLIRDDIESRKVKGEDVAKSGKKKKNSSDDEEDEDVVQEELNQEDRAALVDLFETLLGNDKNQQQNQEKTLTELQFHNFLAASGVTDDEKDLTLKRLKELRPNAKETGIDLETFISLF